MRFTSRLAGCGAIGLDIGNCSVKAVQYRGKKLVASARFARINAGKPIDAAELSTIAAVLRRQGFAGRSVAVAAPADKLKSAPLELPAKSANVPIDRLARAEFSRLHKVDLASSEFAYWEMPTAIRSGRATSLMSIAYAHADAEQQIAMFESAGLNVRAIDTHGSSLVRACGKLIESGKASAVLDLGWSGTVLVLVRNGVVAYERRIATLALSKLHADIERSMGLSFDEALPVLFEVDATRPVAVTDLLTDFFNETAEELTKTISYARHQFPEAMVERVILAGGGAELPFVAEQLEAICGLQTMTASWDDASRNLSPMASAFGLSQFAA